MEKKEKKTGLCTVDPKICIKLLLHLTPPTILFIYPKILKAFPKTFPTEMNPNKCPAKGKK